MAYCPSVCSYRVVFSNGKVMYPKIPEYVDVWSLADNYARDTLSKDGENVVVMTIQSLD